MQKLSLVCQALRNRQVVRLFTCAIHSSYSLSFISNTNKTLALVDDVINLLVLSQKKKANVFELRKMAKYGHLRLHKNKKNFNIEYLKYRSQNKIRYEYALIHEYLVGGRIMDFGSGDGLFTEYLAKQGYEVWGTDVRDYGKNNQKKSHYFEINKQGEFTKQSLKFDTTIVKSVFHHIAEEKLSFFIQQIHKVTKRRVLIKEDIIVKRNENILIPNAFGNVLFARYHKLTLHEQLQFLALMDYFGNCVVQGLWFINLPFNFNSIDEWSNILKIQKIKIKQTIPMLYDINMMHPGPHVWLVCDVDK